MVSCLSLPYNQVETKHVESTLVPRLDEGSSPSNSTIKQTTAGLIVGGRFSCYLIVAIEFIVTIDSIIVNQFLGERPISVAFWSIRA